MKYMYCTVKSRYIYLDAFLLILPIVIPKSDRDFLAMYSNSALHGQIIINNDLDIDILILFALLKFRLEIRIITETDAYL